MGEIRCRYCDQKLGTTSLKEDVLELCGEPKCYDQWLADNPQSESKSIEEIVADLISNIDSLNNDVEAIGTKIGVETGKVRLTEAPTKELGG